MSKRPDWDRCIHHRGEAATRFVSDYFSQEDRKVLLIGGAGFDPRSLVVTELLSIGCGVRLRGLFLREERPNPTIFLKQQADENDKEIRKQIAEVDIFPVDVFDIDSAPVGGRRAVKALDDRMQLDSVTDIVLDCSALSVGIMFPFARYCLQRAKASSRPVNFHVLVIDDPATDASIQSTAYGKAAPLHTFNGKLGLEATSDAARLWLPQLGTGKRKFLNLIHHEVKPHAVCPIIPFPARDPRTGDRLIEEYGDLFEGIGDPMTPTWNVDSRDLVHAHERSPLDLYRAILRIDDARTRVFAETGGSQIILSPLGSKAVAVGLLMAALERDFSVISVETVDYQIVPSESESSSGELVHLWLHGEAYSSDTKLPGSER